MQICSNNIKKRKNEMSPLYLLVCCGVCGLSLQTAVATSSLQGAPVAECCYLDNFLLSQLKYHLNIFAAVVITCFCHCPCGPSHLAADDTF